MHDSLLVASKLVTFSTMNEKNASAASHPDARAAGWSSTLPVFCSTNTELILCSLRDFVEGVSPAQVAAWAHDVPKLQRAGREILHLRPKAARYSTILEYALPLDSRRPDVVVLVEGSVIVVELKGKPNYTQADLDQVASYVRDLRAYHHECASRHVHAVLVPTGYRETAVDVDGVWVTGLADVDRLVAHLASGSIDAPPDLSAFLNPDAYRPLPTLVQAARELFESREVRNVWRARAATDPAVEYLSGVAHEAARRKTRHLALVTGVPGSGKTLVGMRAVHAGYLDDLAVSRSGRQPSAPALFLSGNGPLVEVLQHVLRKAGGGGQTFIRHIKSYMDSFVPNPARIPNEHLLVFDEAQRAFTPDKVKALHTKWPASIVRSEPQHFVDICERIPEWSVLVGLVGTGQEIHLGEEGGITQWRDAIRSSRELSRWTVHAPAELEPHFAGQGINVVWQPALNLCTELRFHLASALHEYVGELLDEKPSPHGVSYVADRLWAPRGARPEGMRLWATRSLDHAKEYLWDRYKGEPEARFGVLASSRDKTLAKHGIDNSWQATKRVRLGPWFGDDEESSDSCRRLDQCVTEFGVQGLELEMALLGWGSDLRRHGGRWSDDLARKYKPGGVVLRDPFQLRRNAYRVLLTRGRDGTVVFVPKEAVLDETWDYLLESGFRHLP